MVAAPAKLDLRRAFDDYDRQIAIRRIRLGCVVAMVLLPAGALVDWQLFERSEVERFFRIRLLGAGLMGAVLALVVTEFGQRWHRALGVFLALIAAGTMAWIVAGTGDRAHPYYAGLNLVLLAVGLLLQWNLRQSLAAAVLIFGMYVAVAYRTFEGLLPAVRTEAPSSAAIPDPDAELKTRRGIFNNCYFLVVTGVIVVIGNAIQTRLRIREFEARQNLKASQEQLAASNQDLISSQRLLASSNQDLLEREEELKTTNERLREMDEIKGRFFANISHELRTPLTLLIAPLEVFRLKPVFASDAKLRDTLDMMHANGMRLLKLINDLLDLVRLDSGALQLRKAAVEVEPFLRTMRGAVTEVAAQKSLKLGVNVDPDLKVVWADVDKLEKVFLNLLFNAVKFTPAGGSITLSADLEGDAAVFRVKDTGMGISEEQLPHIFERFWQADSSAQRKFQGVGIGLALVRELVTAHGGSVEAQSDPGKGATMIVRLPAKAPEAAPQAEPATAPEAPAEGLERALPAPAAAVPAPAPAEDRVEWLTNLNRRAEMFPGILALRDSPAEPSSGTGRKPRLLVADDEHDMRRFLRSQLSDEYEIIEAVDGDQAATMAAQYLPDVIVCDMMMPEKDGLQVCAELREKTSTRSLPFLMLTARADEITKIQALASGANDFLTKPFSVTEIRVRLKNLVESHSLQRQPAWQNRKLVATVEQLKETETQLVQTEKLASLGRMSAGIIHEINNPLNYAISSSRFLTRKTAGLPEELRAPFDEALKDIDDGLTRVATIIGDLRVFSHPSGAIGETVDVDSVITSAMRFLSAECKDSATMASHIPAGFTVRANRNKLMQVFVNLMQNSLDAMSEKNYGDEKPLITITAEDLGDTRQIRVRDNGPGIAAANLPKIFEPFFTTKEVGKGTGLGLSICHRIISETGGRIFARSELGQWCEFTLEFPVTS